MKLTRRQLATVLAPGAALAKTAAQPATAPPDEELRMARERTKTNGETLAAQAVPMATEPAFHFRV
jgi:hypothetical protein